MRAALLILLTVVAGEALPPDAVPVMCAAICGPIVELSSMCSPKRSFVGFDSHHMDSGAHDRHARRHDGKRVEEDEKREKRFSVIVPAPTTFPPDLVAGPDVAASSPESWDVPTAPAQPPAQNYAPPTPPQPAPVPAPAQSTTSNDLPPTPPPGAFPSTTPSTVQPPIASKGPKKQTTASPTSRHVTSSMPVKIYGSNGKMTDGLEKMQDAEERCVCLNTSFNVAEIAGLCASCIGMVADTQNDMEVIMSVCGFPSQQYSPDKDKLASNIWVKATRPTVGVKTSRTCRSKQVASLGMIMGVGVGVALMML